MKTIKNNISIILLFIILAISAFFRIYNINNLLGFWYDQGRDALVIWDLLHYHRFFLIGPVTGIEGIFLGPFYYYLLTPFYFLGKGSPVFVSACLSWMTIGTIYLIYYLTEKIFNKTAALIASLLYGFSYGLVVFSRWLANPNPLPFFTLLLLISLYNFIVGKTKGLIWVGLLLGLCLQLEAASAVFFIPSIIFILIWKRKLINLKYFIISAVLFILTLLPQIIFNFRHEGVLVGAFKHFLISEKSFKLSLHSVINLRLLIYYDVFTSKIFPSLKYGRLAVLALFSAGFVFFGKTVLNTGGKLLGVWLFLPLIGYLFYQGNNGYIWDYYFTGIIPAFIILLSSILFQFWKKGLIAKILFIAIMVFFVYENVDAVGRYLKNGIGIKLGAQLKALDWIYKDAGKEDFNVDVYVPPQIFFSYSYLFRWYGTSKYGREPNTNQVKKLYTLAEPDGEHPQFLAAWLKRQDNIGKIESVYSWGDITVQKRERTKYE